MPPPSLFSHLLFYMRRDKVPAVLNINELQVCHTPLAALKIFVFTVTNLFVRATLHSLIATHLRTCCIYEIAQLPF